jgi:putative ABC transport system substrate-binding protein
MQFDQLKRREFITLLSGAAAWPMAARGQQRERMRRIGVLSPYSQSDLEAVRIAEFRKALAELGWIEGNNVRFDIRWGASDPGLYRTYAAELFALAPDIVWATNGVVLDPLLQATSSVPIVFTYTIDPVGAGRIESLARPGGNATGFTYLDYGVSGKWLELLKEIAPRVTRVAVLRDPTNASGPGQLGAITSVAPSFGVELFPVGVRDAAEIERGIAAFMRGVNGGLVVTASTSAAAHRDAIIKLAAVHRLPAVYANRSYPPAGGLISYGPTNEDQLRLAAGYVDRILKGEKPSDLPVQAPTKYETVLNMKTAKALGLDVPTSVLLRADEVIE